MSEQPCVICGKPAAYVWRHTDLCGSNACLESFVMNGNPSRKDEIPRGILHGKDLTRHD